MNHKDRQHLARTVQAKVQQQILETATGPARDLLTEMNILLEDELTARTCRKIEVTTEELRQYQRYLLTGGRTGNIPENVMIVLVAADLRITPAEAAEWARNEAWWPTVVQTVVAHSKARAVAQTREMRRETRKG